MLNGCKEPYFSSIIDYLNIHVDLQVKLFHTNEANVSNARNISLDNANGEYITFVDSDDYVSPMYLKELYENVAPDTVSISNLYMFNDGVEFLIKRRHAEAKEHIIGVSIIM